jgi:hypothetical protein
MPSLIDLKDVVDVASAITQVHDPRQLREDIYLGKGYHVIRGFLDPGQVEHMRSFWRTHDNAKQAGHWNKKRLLHQGCPDVTVRTPELTRHFNFFWNKPIDVFTYVTAWRLQSLRNAIEGNPPSKDYFPHHDRNAADDSSYCVTSYRVTMTSSGGAVDPHADWPLDHARVQLSLMLSSHGDDYRGGLLFSDGFRGGKMFNLGQAEQLRAGDLVVMRYSQPHGVEPVESEPGQLGMCRLLMPHEMIPKRTRFRQAMRDLSRPRKPALTSVPAAEASTYYDEEVGRLMRLAIREGFEPSEVYYHRGLWGRFKPLDSWQFDILKQQGLEPQHDFLDIGCGIMRLGMRLIPYLDDDRYCGVDPLPAYIKLAHVYMREVVETTRKYRLSCDADFGFGVFERKFDFAMAQSVFTHMTFAQIERCLTALKPVMKPLRRQRPYSSQ